jgi:hypothetical protein
MTKVLEFVFDRSAGKALVAALAAVTLFAGWLWRHDSKIEARVETKIITEAKEAGKVAHAKSRQAHRAARQPGAAERVFAKYCVDCR